MSRITIRPVRHRLVIKKGERPRITIVTPRLGPPGPPGPPGDIGGTDAPDFSLIFDNQLI